MVACLYLRCYTFTYKNKIVPAGMRIKLIHVLQMCTSNIPTFVVFVKNITKELFLYHINMEMKTFTFSFLLIQVSPHLYVRVYLPLLMYCGSDEFTVEFECFHSNSALLTLSELQCTEGRREGSIAAGSELSLLQPDSFDNQISGQRITLMDHMAWNLKRREGIRV